MGHPSIVIALIAGSSLECHTDGGHGTVVLKGSDGQPIGQGGDFQGLSLDQLPLSLSHGLRLGSKCSLGSGLKSTIVVCLFLS